jgi:hypothetical protein
MTHVLLLLRFKVLQPSLMNFCVTDGESVVVTRYISSKKDEAASLVSVLLIGVSLSCLSYPSGFLLGQHLVNMLKEAIIK